MIAGALFKPSCRVKVGPVEIINLDEDGLRIAFELTRTNTPPPDHGVIRVWNLHSELSRQIRLAFQSFGTLEVELHVGFQGVTVRVFLGHLIEPRERSDGQHDTILELEVGDGAKGFHDAQVQVSTLSLDARTILDIAIATLNLELPPDFKPYRLAAETEAVLATVLPQAAVSVVQEGYSAASSARGIIDEAARILSCRWWIRDSEIVLCPVGQALPGPTVVLRPSTGLLEPLEIIGYDRARFVALLQPQLLPGRLALLQDDLGKPLGEGAYRLDVVRYLGDLTPGGPWVAECEGRRASLL